ncbi:MAG: TVP38/TMEM64 family protein, partial [bacterium]|nr:TVP38/TMEM64 family protein [bacterium]
FIIFIVPGLPKDFMIYVAGVTAMRSGRFFAILVMGRLPWIMASAGIGANINAGNYFLTILITVISVIGFIVGMVYKEKIIKKLTKED